MKPPASKIARQVLWALSLVGLGSAGALGALIMTQMSGCCGGPPSGACDFVEVIDASADASLICGGEVCVPGVSQCCFQLAGAVFMCTPIESPCPGQAATCDGDEDCGQSLHCCGIFASNRVQCQPSCPGDPNLGTVRLCHANTECPPELPFCVVSIFNGRQIQTCSLNRQR